MNKLSAVVFLIIAFIFAIVLAVDIGTEDYEKIGIYLGIGTIVYFLVHGWKNIWWFTAILIFSGVVFSQGFVFAAIHLFVLMLLIASLISLLHRDFMPQAPELRAAGSRGTAVVVGILLLYGGLHFLVNKVFPYSPNDYSIKTSAKAYFECYASMFCFFWLLIGPYGFKLKDNWIRTLLLVIFLALIGNVAINGWMYSRGYQSTDGLEEFDAEANLLYVPVINMQAGIYTLRELAPLSFVLLLTLASAPGWWRGSTRVVKLLVVFSVGLCLVGAVMSGGRATLILCLLLAGAVALYRRHIGLVGVMGVALVFTFAFANIFSFQINTKAPMYVARSLQMLMITKGDSANTIQASQNVRNAAIKEALEQWRKDNRVLFFGRSVFRITHDDAQYVRNTQGDDGFVLNAMRSGRTHNLVTDLLLQYGLTGFFLYISAYISVIRFFRRLSRIISSEQVIAKALASSMVIYLPIIMVYQLLGGNYMPIVVPLVIGLVRSLLVAHGTVAPVVDPRVVAAPVPRSGRSLVAIPR